MTEQELREIRERADAATPGPWEHDNESIWKVGDFDYGHGVMFEWAAANLYGANKCQVADSSFLAHSRTDIPRLLDEITFLRSLLHDRVQDSALAAAAEERARAEERDKVNGLRATLNWLLCDALGGDRWAADAGILLDAEFLRRIKERIKEALESTAATAPAAPGR